MKYYYEILTPHAPGMTWMRSPHSRDSWDRAMEEGVLYCKYHHDHAGMKMAVRVHVEG